MNFNKIDLTPLVVLILIILIVFCLFGAVIANRDLFNMNSSSDQAEAQTATQDANALLHAKQKATLTAMETAKLEEEIKLDELMIAKTENEYNHMASIEEQEAIAAQVAAKREREEMKNDAKAFAETAFYYILPFALVAAAIMVTLIVKAGIKIKKERAEAQRINAHRKLRAFRENQKVLAATTETGLVASQSQHSDAPLNEQNAYIWPSRAEIVTKK